MAQKKWWTTQQSLSKKQKNDKGSRCCWSAYQKNVGKMRLGEMLPNPSGIAPIGQRGPTPPKYVQKWKIVSYKKHFEHIMEQSIYHPSPQCMNRVVHRPAYCLASVIVAGLKAHFSSSKYPKIAGGCGFAQDPTGGVIVLPRPLSWIQKGEKGKRDRKKLKNRRKEKVWKKTRREGNGRRGRKERRDNPLTCIRRLQGLTPIYTRLRFQILTLKQ